MDFTRHPGSQEGGSSKKKHLHPGGLSRQKMGHTCVVRFSDDRKDPVYKRFGTPSIVPSFPDGSMRSMATVTASASGTPSAGFTFEEGGIVSYLVQLAHPSKDSVFDEHPSEKTVWL